MLLALHPNADLPVGFLSIPEAAEVLRISKGFAYELVEAGEIPVKRYGRRELVLVAWVERCADEVLDEWRARRPAMDGRQGPASTAD